MELAFGAQFQKLGMLPFSRYTEHVFSSAEYGNRPFPIETVRDLLGIARATYRCQRDDTQPHRGDLNLLKQAGVELRTALQLGQCAAGSMGHSAAWKRAKKGAARLCQYVGDSGSLASVVRIATAPLRDVPTSSSPQGSPKPR